MTPNPPDLLATEKVLRTQVVPLVRNTPAGLMETIRKVFEAEGRVQRMEYIRGESLRVERMMDRAAPGTDELLTPFQMVRQHAHITVQEIAAPNKGFLSVLRALKKLSDEKLLPTFVLCRSLEEVNTWVFPKGEFTVDVSFRLPVYEDPDTPSGAFFVCGSSVGPLLADVESAVLCRM